MGDWSTYSPRDFVMFSARAYYGLFASVNHAVWPWQVLIVLVAIGAAIAVVRGERWARSGALVIAAACVVVAWMYFVREYASIHTFARWFAAAFAVQGALLAIAVMRSGPAAPALSTARARISAALLTIAIVGWPLLAPALGRGWTDAEIIALAPDPTILACLGAGLALARARWWLWPIPIAWTAYDALTLHVLGAREALLPPAILLAAAAVTFVSNSRGLPRRE